MAKLKTKFRRGGGKKPPNRPQVPAVTGGRDGAVMLMAGKYARHAVLTVFDNLGGTDAMTLWAEDNQTDFYTKLFPKIVTREVEEHRVDTVESLLEAIDAEVEEVPDAVDAEYEDV